MLKCGKCKKRRAVTRIHIDALYGIGHWESVCLTCAIRIMIIKRKRDLKQVRQLKIYEKK